MHSGSPNPGLHPGQPPHDPQRIARTTPAPEPDTPLLVTADGRAATALRQAVGLDSARDPVPNLAVVDADDATVAVIPGQATLDAVHRRLLAVNGDYLDGGALAEYADAVSRLRARLPRSWRTGTVSVPA